MINRLFNHEAVSQALREPTGWRGTLDGRPTLFEKDLFSHDGYKITLHRIVGSDDAGAFHSHPAIAIRCVLSGGYVEEFPDNKRMTRAPGYIGLVYPQTVHRIYSLLNEKESISLWIRLPKTDEIRLVGEGWNDEILKALPTLIPSSENVTDPVHKVWRSCE